MTREQAVEYLDKVTDAWRVIQTAELPINEWYTSTPYARGERLPVHGLEEIIDALGYPRVRKHFCEDADQYVLYWKGVEVYTLVWPARIGEKKEVTL